MPATPVERYVHGHHASVLAAHATRTAANSCGYFLDRLRPGDTILDLGCGPGTITCDLAERVGETGRVVGVDFASDAVDTARQTARERGRGNVTFAVGDLYQLDLEPASFDVVHAHQVLQHVPDPVAALREMAAYVKPGGLIAVRDADYGAMTWHPASPGLDTWRAVYSAGARASGAEPDAGRRLRSWVLAAGLEVVAATGSVWTYATPETTGWWAGSQADRIRHSAFIRHAQAQGLSAAEIEQIAASWQEWGEKPDAWFFLPHGEIVATTAHTDRPGAAS